MPHLRGEEILISNMLHGRCTPPWWRDMAFSLPADLINILHTCTSIRITYFSAPLSILLNLLQTSIKIRYVLVAMLNEIFWI